MFELMTKRKAECYNSALQYIEFILTFSFTYEIHIFHPNFIIYYFRSDGYVINKLLHYGKKAIFLGSKQKVKISSLQKRKITFFIFY